MQVKKYEAKTMKEALEMVKSELGPDAIILATKDNSRRFGQNSPSSFEITAAVSETTLKKKNFAQTKLNEKQKENFSRSSARTQKQFIEKVVDNQIRRINPEVKKVITRPQYVDIVDDEVNDQVPKRSPPSNSQEVLSLQQEIVTLKKIIAKFQAGPQTFITAHPGANYGLSYDTSFMFEKLVGVGMNVEHVVNILQVAEKEISPLHLKKKANLEAWTAKYILDEARATPQPDHRLVQCFVGSPGHGKTSMLVKVASHLLVQERKKVAVFSADTVKLGAVEQLKIYSQILNVPFATLRSRADWHRLLSSVGKVDCVLVDFPGLTLNEVDEISFIKQILPPSEIPSSVHLVMSSTIRENDGLEILRKHRGLPITDLAFTRLDESTQPGLMFSLSQKTNLALHSFGTGARIPEDFEFASREKLLDLIFKISKQTKIERANEWERSQAPLHER